MNFDWKKTLPHIVAVVVFLSVSMAYFYPALEGYMINSHDIKMHKGMSKEIKDHRETYGEEPLWTNSMFGGMPATQISVVYDSNIIGKISKAMMSALPHPINYLFLYMIGFYILLLCMKVDPWLALAGSIAYGFSSYFFIIMGAGHNSKAVAVGFMAPTLGGMLLAYRKKVFLGTAIMTFFMALQINANHPQVTYYFFMLLFFIFVYKAIEAFKKKEQKSFLKKVSILAVGVVLAVSTNIPNLYGTYEYSPYTQRGGSELADNSHLNDFADRMDENILVALKSTGCEKPACILEISDEELMAKTGLPKSQIEEARKILSKKGMKKDYALQWSYGLGETWNFFIPNIKGGTSSALLGNREFVEMEGNNELKELLNLNYEMYRNGATGGEIITDYFGNQASTSGPVYIGAIVCLLFILGMVFWTNHLKWPLLAMVILSVALAWGKNLMWLTDLFWDYAPVYKNFRAVTIILVMVELILPLVGFLWLYDVVKNREKYQGTLKLFGKKEVDSQKLFFGVSGAVALITLLFAMMPGLVELDSDGDKEFFEAATFTAQLNTMVSRNPQVVPQEYAQNPLEYASALSQAYIPKLKPAHEQLRKFREGVVQKDALRTFVFVVLGVILLYFFIYKNIQTSYFAVGLSVIMLVDFWGVDLRYFDNEIIENQPGLVEQQNMLMQLYGLDEQPESYKLWQIKQEKLMPFTPNYADFAIMSQEMAENPKIGQELQAVADKKKNEKGSELSYMEDAVAKFGRLNQLTDYRVFLLSQGYSQETSVSYFHKSLGGYHSAKIQRYQDLIERKMNRQMQLASNPTTLEEANILNMLNTKYILLNPSGSGKFIDVNNPETLSPENQQKTPGFINRSAFGNAWFVSEVKPFNAPDDEFAAIDSVDLKNFATTDETFAKNKGIVGKYANNGSMVMTSYKANEITYGLENVTGGDHYAVFSEIYYPLGWNAYVDGKQVEVNRVDYTLRGVRIPEGTKEVKLKYELKSYSQLSTVALISSALILLLVIGFGYLSIFKKADA